jgi:hypothetical protein
MTKFFYVLWIMVFPPLIPFFSESNNLKAHISILSFPYGKLGWNIFSSEFLMIITCTMTCVIKHVLFSHYFHSVNLGNYGLSCA